MKWLECKLLFAFTQTIIIVDEITLALSQRTPQYARQGSANNPPQVNIPSQGTIIGKEVVMGRTQRVVQYLGIPYAQPPLVNLRFAAPQTKPLPSWSGTRDGTKFAPSCQQVSSRKKLHERLYMKLLPNDMQDPGFSEDCLFLNIFVPEGNAPAENLPVMVWFHSGDFNTGTPALWNPTILVSRSKMVVVTVAYRLNIFGFFTTMDAEAPGNYGMLDQVAALDWVKNNIESFNGSPTNVMIAGHSSGAISVGLHIVSPLSKGKFAKALAMSGDAINSVNTPDREAPVVDSIADIFGCDRTPTSALMDCLREVEEVRLVTQSANIETWGPLVDAETVNNTEPFLSQKPREILESGIFNAVPLIVGFTNNEQALAYIEAFPTDPEGKLSTPKFEMMISEEIMAAVQSPIDNSTGCEAKPHLLSEAVLFFYKPHPPVEDSRLLRDKYLDMQTEKNYASGLSYLAGKVGKREQAYVYRFDYRAKTKEATKELPDWAGVPHMFELPFLWGLPYTNPGTFQWVAQDKKVADLMMAIIDKFARTGNPSQMNLKWEPFRDTTPGILLINRNSEMGNAQIIDYKALAFWNDYYPFVLVEASTCCNATSAAASLLSTTHFVTYNLIANIIFTLSLLLFTIQSQYAT